MRWPQVYRLFALVQITSNPYITENSDMSETASNKPVHVLRRRGVKVSIFENRSGDTLFHKFTIQKTYRDDTGAWKTTASYGRDDAPIIRMLSDRAWEWILDREEQGKQLPTSGGSNAEENLR